MPDNDFYWFVSVRRQEYAGEARANLLRVLAIAAFYCVQLVNYRGLDLPFLHLAQVEGVDRRFHLAMTVIAAAWALSGWAVLLFLRRGLFPAGLKFLSTGLDFLYLTAALLIADGPKSPLVAAYFPVLALSALRFDLLLMRFATASAMGGYLLLTLHSASLRPLTSVPPYAAANFLLALLFSGILLGQVLRRTRTLADDYAAREGKA
ncbi:MAG TPA: hypothetical protein DCM05_09205 [Elusimicrobia bacterium]|nr:hypothetical protein [Elusimicrobiota bacterium]